MALIIGSRDYPCGHSHTTTKGLEEGVYSRRCKKCGAHWVLHVDPALMQDRFPGLLKMTWGKS